MIKAVLVDDEYPALQTMEEFAASFDFLKVVGKFLRPSEAMEFILMEKPDLLLMDIQMPGISGINLLSQLPSGQTCIFLSANPEYAVHAYELDVVDYVLKPYTKERFRKAVEKAKEFINYKKTDIQKSENFIMIKSDYMIHKIPVNQILWIEGLSEYIKILTSNKTHLVLMRLSEFEEQNKVIGFVRIHKSYIVHRDAIVSFSSTIVKLKSGKELPVGKVYKTNLGM